MVKRNNKSRVLMIGGPTAVGKTALAIRLANEFNGVIINADAFQIYKGMDIGTAKPTPAERAAAPHRLIDIEDPDAGFTAAKFVELAKREIERATAESRMPILVGGTGFYLNALRLGLPLGAKGAGPERQHWEDYLAAHGQNALWLQLQVRDPKAAAEIPQGNSRRVIRALEVISTTGGLFSEQGNNDPEYDCLVVGLNTERSVLYDRINARVDQMIEAGLEKEAHAVYERFGAHAQGLAAIGYKEFIPYWQGEQSLADTVVLIKRNSRRYAKRQLTYFRNAMPTHWFDLLAHPEQYSEISKLVYTWFND